MPVLIQLLLSWDLRCYFLFMLLDQKSTNHLDKQQPLIPGNTYSHVKHFLIKGLKGNKEQCAQILVDSAPPCLLKIAIMKAHLQVQGSVGNR